VSKLYHRVFLSTGSNQGNSIANLNLANILLSQQIGLVKNSSSFYQTSAWGKTDQPDFMNQCIEIITPFPPKMLMQKILQIEKQLGRIRHEKWGPRTIDIDILIFDNLILRDNDLVIPHPQMQNRNFVLAPLAEIAPKLIHPSLKKTMKQLVSQTSDALPIKKLLFS